MGISFDRAGNLMLVQRADPPILVLDASGQRLIRSFGDGLFVEPHGSYFLSDGSIWVTDVDSRDGKGRQVIKVGVDGKVMQALGTKGVGGSGRDTFIAPTGVVIGQNGDVFISDGHRREGTTASSITPRMGGS